ncbi:MAG: four-carbon acid sugar kinase family protein, partial [Verrucomicrobia bacterium]|nr:four-carbon acid sugar kinase family protein [Verrucomicrobiota bacterium]
MAILGCIADDFTGGTDLANNLVKSGFRTIQTIGVPTSSSTLTDADAIVVALKTRTCPVNEAIAASRNALAWLQSFDCKQYYLKYCSTFDSTPAGNIGPVIEILLKQLGEDFSISCPAFPDNGRTLYRGHLFVHDQLLNESGMQHHPLTPMTDPNILRLLRAQTTLKIGLIRLDTIRAGSEAIASAFAVAKREGVRIALTDATTNEDLAALAAAACDLKLITGGSGLALKLGDNFGLNVNAAVKLTSGRTRRAIL